LKEANEGALNHHQTYLKQIQCIKAPSNPIETFVTHVEYLLKQTRRKEKDMMRPP
jgi:hypothetical protein